jgi:hypothetical protein
MTHKDLINNILKYASLKDYPDIHLNTNSLLKIRNKSGDIEDVKTVIFDSNEINIPVLSDKIIE